MQEIYRDDKTPNRTELFTGLLTFPNDKSAPISHRQHQEHINALGQMYAGPAEMIRRELSAWDVAVKWQRTQVKQEKVFVIALARYLLGQRKAGLGFAEEPN